MNILSRVLISSLFLLEATCHLNAMDKKDIRILMAQAIAQQHKAKKPQAIILCDDGTVALSSEQVKTLKSINDYVSDVLEANPSACSDPILFNVSGLDTGSTLSTTIIKTLLTLDNNPTMQLNPLSLPILHQAAEFLGARKKVKQIIAQQYLNKIPNTNINSEILQELQWNLPKSVSVNIAQTARGILDLSNQKLKSLDGIQHFASKTIKILKLDNNKLSSFNTKQLKKIFPGLKIITARDNRITHLSEEILEDCDDVKIYLDNNPIDDIAIPTGKKPENAFIELTNTPLSAQDIEKVNLFLQKASAWQTKRHALLSKIAILKNTIGNGITTFFRLSNPPLYINGININPCYINNYINLTTLSLILNDTNSFKVNFVTKFFYKVVIAGELTDIVHQRIIAPLPLPTAIKYAGLIGIFMAHKKIIEETFDVVLPPIEHVINKILNAINPENPQHAALGIGACMITLGALDIFLKKHNKPFIGSKIVSATPIKKLEDVD